MELLKNLFSEGEALTYDQLTEKINAAGMKLANIADGSYVSRDKMDSKVKGLQGQITDLQAQVKQRVGAFEFLGAKNGHQPHKGHHPGH